MDDSFYEAKGSNSRNGDTWRLGFYKTMEAAQKRAVEEIDFDNRVGLKHRRYYVVTHVFRD